MTSPLHDGRFDAWMRDLERRHSAGFEFRELARALRALSTRYVQRRQRLVRAGALDSAGKRAVFALYYAPLHFLLVADVLRSLGATRWPVTSVVDLGCGTGAAGAAWAASLDAPSRVIGVDQHPWALDEASRTYRAFGLRSRLVKRSAAAAGLPARQAGIISAFVANELRDETRGEVLRRLLDAADRGAAVLVVEPIARSLTPWWEAWRAAFAEHGGRDDDWRLPVSLPPLLARLDRAAGLSHDILTARSLWVAPRRYDRPPRKR